MCVQQTLKRQTRFPLLFSPMNNQQHNVNDPKQEPQQDRPEYKHREREGERQDQ